MTKSTEQSSDASRKRRPYEPPAVEDTVSFETLALSCNKQPGDFNCDFINPPPKFS